jgi:hypothetical protein
MTAPNKEQTTVDQLLADETIRRKREFNTMGLLCMDFRGNDSDLKSKIFMNEAPANPLLHKSAEQGDLQIGCLVLGMGQIYTNIWSYAEYLSKQYSMP